MKKEFSLIPNPLVARNLGFDFEYTEKFLPAIDFLARYYWRVSTEGMEHIPDKGPCLVVANHSGILPYDAMMVKYAIFRRQPPRLTWVLIERFIQLVPYLNVFFRRTGQVLANTDNALYLLRNGELVLVFPEGVKGIAKPYRDRYRLARFGRGGFVETAIKAQAPIIPVAVVGAEEIYHMVHKFTWPFKNFGIPFFPITTTFPWLGPLGAIPKPTKWSIRFLPPVTDHLEIKSGPGDDLAVQKVAEQVRMMIQNTLIEMLKKRRSIYF